MGRIDVGPGNPRDDDKLEKAIERALEMAGGIVESAAKENLTANGSVDTGLLRNSITHALDGAGQVPADAPGTRSVYIGTNVEYAPFVELGHSQQPGRFVPAIGRRLVAEWVQAKPFLRPAAESSKGKIKRAFEIAFKDL